MWSVNTGNIGIINKGSIQRIHSIGSKGEKVYFTTHGILSLKAKKIYFESLFISSEFFDGMIWMNLKVVVRLQ